MTQQYAIRISIGAGIAAFVFLTVQPQYFALGENLALPNAGGNTSAIEAERVTSTIGTQISNAAPKATSTKLSADFSLLPGQTIAVPSEELSVRFEGVAGETVLMRLIAKHNVTTYMRLSLTSDETRAQTSGEYTLTLQQFEEANGTTAVFSLTKKATSTEEKKR